MMRACCLYGLEDFMRRPCTATPTGKLMLNVLGGVAEFEREMMRACCKV